MDITAFIPRGKENAISRDELMTATGLPDRQIRNLIHEARRDALVLSLSEGGYYLPTENEINEVEEFYKRESKRAKSIFWTLKSCRDWLNETKNKKEPETFLVEATRCKRCGGLLTSEEAVNNGYGHTCMKREKAEEEEKKSQISIFDEVARC